MSASSNRRKARAILTIVGPTAVGKTAVAMVVAKELRGEIISADSRQVYRGMDIGTSKPTAEERAAVRHHLIDVAEPSETYDAARFAGDAETAIAGLLASGIEPVVVGGTGFYVASLFEGLFEGPGRDEAVREELKERAASEGVAVLHRELAAVDPAAAERIHPNDAARVVRALEVFLSTGKTLSQWHSDGGRPPAYRPAYFGLRMPREELYSRIDRRVDAMMEAGLLEEVGELVRSGRLRGDMPAATAVGYRELIPIVSDLGGDAAQAAREIKQSTRRYAKRQMTWFSSHEGIRWIDVAEAGTEGAAREILSVWGRMKARP